MTYSENIGHGRRNRSKRLVFFSILLFFASFVFAVEVEEKIQEAEKAFMRGDVAKALEIYKEVLRRNPEHLPVLKRAALLSSWEGDFEESINYYKKAIQLDPQDHQLRLKLAEVYSWNKDFDSSIDLYSSLINEEPGNMDLQVRLARVLSWAKRYQESISQYEKILERDPANKGAKLGLAQVLSWKGDFKRSIEKYRELEKRDPQDIQVLVGLAQVLSWDGHLEESRKFYNKALDIQPDSLDAQIGLGWVLLWMGEKRKARKLASKIIERNPDNREAIKLYQDVKKSGRPTFTAGYDRIDDTDNNQISIYRGTLLFHPEPQTDLMIHYARYDLELRGASASADSYFLSLASRINDHHSIQAKVGEDRIKDDFRKGRSFIVGYFSYKNSVNERFYWEAGVERETFKASVDILKNDIRVDTAHIDFFLKWKEHWQADARYEWGRLSDENGRNDGSFSLKYTFPLKRPRLSLSYKFRFLSYDENLESGYFDPQRFISNIGNFEIAGTSPGHLFYYNLQIETGIQKFHFDVNGMKEESGNDRVLGVTGAFGFHIRDRSSMEFYYNHSDYALQVATGFESTSAGIRWIVRF